MLSRRVQLNVYLHDPSRIREGLGYFRVRYESEKAPVATLKIPVGVHEGVREMVEVERPLAELGPGLAPRPRRWVSVADDLPEEMGAHFRALGIGRLRRLGSMRNLRCVVRVGEAGEVEVDRTTLPDGSLVHEVEIESPDPAVHRALADLVRSWAPSARPSLVGKFTRFLDAVS